MQNNGEPNRKELIFYVQRNSLKQWKGSRFSVLFLFNLRVPVKWKNPKTFSNWIWQCVFPSLWPHQPTHTKTHFFRFVKSCIYGLACLIKLPQTSHSCFRPSWDKSATMLGDKRLTRTVQYLAKAVTPWLISLMRDPPMAFKSMCSQQDGEGGVTKAHVSSRLIIETVIASGQATCAVCVNKNKMESGITQPPREPCVIATISAPVSEQDKPHEVVLKHRPANLSIHPSIQRSPCKVFCCHLSTFEMTKTPLLGGLSPIPRESSNVNASVQAPIAVEILSCPQQLLSG